jgi:hypothetical protein
MLHPSRSRVLVINGMSQLPLATCLENSEFIGRQVAGTT